MRQKEFILLWLKGGGGGGGLNRGFNLPSRKHGNLNL